MHHMNHNTFSIATMNQQELQEQILAYQKTIKGLITALCELEPIQLHQRSPTRRTVILLLDDLMTDLQDMTDQLIKKYY